MIHNNNAKERFILKNDTNIDNDIQHDKVKCMNLISILTLPLENEYSILT